MMNQLALDVRHLSKTFNGVRVLNDLSLQVATGDGVVAFTGPNAAGKTTVFNLMTGIQHPDRVPAAVIRLFGHDTIGVESWRIARLGVARLFQDARVFLGLSVLQNVQVAAHGSSRASWTSLLGIAGEDAKTRQALEFVDLWDRRQQSAAILSLGDRRKLALAAMLRADARLLLLDEPTANLDARSTANMKDLVRRLAADGRTVILIEHNHEFVKDVADVIYAFSQGACARTTTGTATAAPNGGLR